MKITFETDDTTISMNVETGIATRWTELMVVMLEMLNGLGYVIRDPEACADAAQEENMQWDCSRKEE